MGLGDILGSFTGSTQKKYANEAYQNASAQFAQGRDKGLDAYGQGYSQAQGYVSPYAQQGTEANKRYGTYLGLDGSDAQRSALAEYAGADPFRQFNEDQANRGLMRQFNRMGMLDSGNMRLATARANLERGSQDFGNHLHRLAALGQQGYGASSMLGNFAMQNGQNVAGLWNNFANNQAGAEVQRANALAQAAGILPNNIMKAASMAISAATGMPVSMGGSGGDGQKGGLNYFGGQ